MALTSYLRRRGGCYYGRIAVPTDLIERLGKKEIQQSLGLCRDPGEAKRRINQWVADKRDWFEALRREEPLTSEMIEVEAQDVARGFLGLLTADRMARPPQGRMEEGDYDPREVGLGVSFEEYAEAFVDDDFRRVREEASDIILRLGVVAPEGSAKWVELCRVLLRAHAEAYRAELARHTGDVAATIRLPLNPNLADAFEGERRVAPVKTPPPRPVPSVDGWTLAESIERYAGGRKGAGAWTEATERQHRDSVGMLVEVLGGETPIASITKRQVAEFKALLEQLPATHGKTTADRKRTIQETVAACPAEAPRLSQRTVRRHLTALSGLFRWVKENGQYDGDNPAGGFTFPRSKRARDERPGWTTSQLEALFKSPIWTGCASAKRRAWPGSLIIRDAAYWLPLLGAFAGLRLEEACQLLVADIETEAGIPFVHIRPGPGKLLKSMAAVRRVPIHPGLIEVGFLDYVDEVRGQGHKLVFPALRRGGPDKRLGVQATKDFTFYRRAIGLYAKGVDYHGLRHTFTTALVVSGVDRAVIDELTGHEGEGETSRYTKALPLSVLREAITKLDYGLDLGHLREITARTREGEAAR